MVTYRPDTERTSHYADASLPRLFDAFVWLDETSALLTRAAVPRRSSSRLVEGPPPAGEGEEGRGSGGVGVLVVEQDPVGGAVEVVVLAGAQAPNEGGEAEPAQEQGKRDQVEQVGHGAAVGGGRESRSALPTTRRDEVDMATAAKSGVTRPATASGTANAL